MLIVDGVPVHFRAGHKIQQSYEHIGGRTIQRLYNGDAVIQEGWKKLKTRITGNGWLPNALMTVPTDQAVELHCVVPLAEWLGNITGEIPAPEKGRNDGAYKPYFFALVNGDYVDCPVVDEGSGLVIRPIDSATDYLMCWFPVLQVVATVRTNTDLEGNVISWVFEGEEV